MKIRRHHASAVAVAALMITLGSLAGTGAARSSAAPTPVAQDPLERSLAERGERAARHPADPAAWAALGELQALLGRTADAEASYRRLLELDPAAGHYQLGRLWSGAGRRFAARRELARALELDPRHAGAHYELGSVYDAWDFDRLARRHFARAFELDPALADPDLNPFLGDSRQALAALVGSWEREPAPAAAPTALEPAPRAAVATEPAPAAAEPSATEAAGEAGARGGGFARSTGGSAPVGGGGSAAEAPVEIGAESLRPGARVRRTPAEPGDRVLDAGSLSRGGSVNQIVSPGLSGRGGARSAPRRPAYTPPIEPERPRGFEPVPESTGSIERGFGASDPGRYALGAGAA